MIKTVLSGSFAFEDCVASIVPLHRTGVDGDWMAKRAAAPVFDFSKHDPKQGETLVHLLALGDGEVIGANRNGDYFPKKANQKYHPTFLKACYFHHHDNKDPDKAFGRVVAAAHNDRMGRVELIIGLDNKKAADDLDELEKKGEFSVSMSCRVPFDICSICHNKAASRKDYCKHASMMMGRIMDNGKQACVINDHPDFFDISKVFRGADRIAFTFQKLDKAASDGQVIGGAELAELLNISDVMVPVMRSANPDQKAAIWQKMGQAADGRLSCFKSAARVPEIPDEVIAALKSAGDLGAVFGALHTAGICLPLTSFVRVAGISKPAEVRDGDIQKRVRGLLSSVDAADVQKLSENGSYDGARRPVSTKVASIVAGLRVNNGFLPADAYSRILNQTARAGLDKAMMEKAAGEPSPKAAAIADEYAAYLLALAHENAACDHVEFVQNLTALHALG